MKDNAKGLLLVEGRLKRAKMNDRTRGSDQGDVAHTQDGCKAVGRERSGPRTRAHEEETRPQLQRHDQRMQLYHRRASGKLRWPTLRTLIPLFPLGGQPLFLETEQEGAVRRISLLLLLPFFPILI